MAKPRINEVYTNEETLIKEVILAGKIVSFSDKILVNSKGTEFQTATVIATYPDGSTESVQSVVWTKSLAKSLFKVGDNVGLRTQIEGKYGGNSVIELMNTRVDVSKLAGMLAGMDAPAAVNANAQAVAQAEEVN